MIEAASRLFQRRGYAATGWRAIVAKAGTPSGLRAHCFPGAEEELPIAALCANANGWRGARLADGIDVAATPDGSTTPGNIWPPATTSKAPR
jgi:hypothetical protein